MSSRLFQEVREKRGLCYSVFAFGTMYEDAGQLGVYAATSPDHTPNLMEVTSNVMMSMADEISDKEIDRAKAQLKTSIVMNLESASSRADQIARQFLAFGEVPEMATLIKKIEAVTAEQVREVAKKYLIDDALTVAYLDPQPVGDKKPAAPPAGIRHAQ